MRNRLRNLYFNFINLKFQILNKGNFTQRMSFTKQDLIFQMKQIGVVPVFYHPDVDVLMHVVDISYRCGLRVFEFMHQRDNKGPRLFNYISERAHVYPGIILGAGTVLDATMTERYIQVGAAIYCFTFFKTGNGRSMPSARSTMDARLHDDHRY